jgi:hypothetical protein
MGFSGIDVRESGERVVFRVFLQDGDGNRLGSGTVNMSLYELQHDGSLKAFDFADFSFKAEMRTVATASMVHQNVDGGATETGIWTYNLQSIGNFVAGNVYLIEISCADSFPPQRMYEFQYGGAEGDLKSEELHMVKAALVNKREHTIESGVDVIKDDDGLTTLQTLTPDENNGVVTVTPS